MCPQYTYRHFLCSIFSSRSFTISSQTLHDDTLEVKHLKQLVRDIIDPARDLGHVDRHTNTPISEPSGNGATVQSNQQSIESRPEKKSLLTSSPDKAERTIPIDADAAVGCGPPEDDVCKESC